MEIEIEIQIKQIPKKEQRLIKFPFLFSMSLYSFNNQFQWRFFLIEISSITNDVRNVISFFFSVFPIPNVYTLAA